MPNLSDMFPSNYLKAQDIPGAGVQLIVSGVSTTQMEGETKWVLGFTNSKRGLVLNKTNAGRLGQLYGQETDGWVGKPVTLVSRLVAYQGKEVPAIRVSMDQPAAPQVAPVAQAGAPVASPITDDDIPF